MKSVVRPELPTAAAGSSQAPTAPVDNSAPRSTHPEPTYKSGKTVQITGTTSLDRVTGNLLFVSIYRLDSVNSLLSPPSTLGDCR